MGNGQHPHGQSSNQTSGQAVGSLSLPYQPQASSQYNPQSTEGMSSGITTQHPHERINQLIKILDRSWNDRTAGGSLFFPQASSSANNGSSTYHHTDSFGFLATSATSAGALPNYAHSSTTSATEYAGQSHHLSAGLSEPTWSPAVKSGTTGIAGANANSEMAGWAPAAPASFNSFDNYGSLATGEMFMGHHHQAYADMGKAAASASFSYGHHNPSVVGMSPAAAAAAYRSYNLAKSGSTAAASFGFY